MLSFVNQTAKLNHVNVRYEFAGKNAEGGRAASDLRLVVKGGNQLLDKLDPHLRGSFYMLNEDTKQAELVGLELTKLRHPLLQSTLAYDKKYVGYTVSIDHAGNPETAIVLTDCAVNEFKLTTQEGGTVIIAFQVQFHPLPGQLDLIADKQQQDVRVTMTPPAAEAPKPKPADLVEAAT